MKLIMLQLMVGKPFVGGRRNGKGKLLRRSSLQVRRHTQKNQEQPTHNLYEDDQGLDEKEDEKSDNFYAALDLAVFSDGLFVLNEQHIYAGKMNQTEISRLGYKKIQDKEGNAIQANMDLKDTDYFDQLLLLNNAYRISRFWCTETKKWQRALDNKTTLNFGRYTSIEPIANDPFPEHYLKFIAYNEVQAKADMSDAPLTAHAAFKPSPEPLLALPAPHPATTPPQDILEQTPDTNNH
ncbi:hypothetical protein Tco_0641748 [Tanacetum coccineum]